MDAHLDLMLREKLEDLAIAFHCSRATVLRAVMRWRLSCGQEGRIDDELPDPVQHLFHR